MARIDDGFSTTIAFSASASGVLLTDAMWEKEVTPPGIEAGGAIDTTTMRNTTWRTKKPRQLKSLLQAGCTVAYDPDVIDEIVATIGVNQQITITYPDGETLVFWGWIESWTPNNIVEGEQPTATMAIEPSNQNNSNVETAPVFSS